ncbi:MAG: DUF349 domain-containing protein [Bacteroidetes bacterium]|nr:DUF349 domain-containing protein [Bacteroidota bacterium]
MTEELTPNPELPVNQPVVESYAAQLEEADKLIDNADETHTEQADLTQLDKPGLIKYAGEMLHMADVRKAQESLNQIRDAFEAIQQAERPVLIKEWADAGNDPRDFKLPQDPLRNELNQIMQRFREKREEERRRAEEEKQANLKQKESVLARIKALAEGEESEQGLKEMRELMREWREIRQIPKEFKDDLFERYKFYLDMFYDKMGKLHELKDLDREKNLELKIELIKKAEALKDEKNVRKALLTLNKYHEDWRNAGPVRREISDDIWQRFKAASDQVIADKKAVQEEMDKLHGDNLRLKTLLVEKAELAITAQPATMKEWNAAAKEMDALLNEWKTIGPVPSQQNEAIWGRFSAARNAFYAGRKEFLKTLNAGREDNLKKKMALCEEAEKLQDSNDFHATMDALGKLQEDWKKIGPVPEAKNDAVWKRFRAAFDHFYARKNAWAAQRKAEEAGAVQIRESIIAELEGLREAEDAQAVFNQLKDAQSRWVKAGFVSGKQHYNLQKKYQDISDFLFKKFKRSSDELKEGVMKEHYGTLAGAPDGKFKLQSEERRIKDRIARAQQEMSTLENNMSFFANSKNAGPVLKQFEANIKKAQEQIARLEKELKVIRGLKNQNV